MAAPSCDASHDEAFLFQRGLNGRCARHIRPIREDRHPKRRLGRRKARRWVVERTLAWLSKCRVLLVRNDKHEVNNLGLIQLSCGRVAGVRPRLDTSEVLRRDRIGSTLHQQGSPATIPSATD